MSSKPYSSVISSGPSLGLIKSNAAEIISSTLNYEMMVAWHAMSSEKATTEFFNEVFDELYYNFGQYMDTKSSSQSKMFKHVYEWNEVGSSNKRLWKWKKVGQSPEGFKIKPYFITSKVNAPIDPVLQIPGPTGKVVKRTGIFKDKASVIEFGQPVTIRVKTARYLAVPNKNLSPGSSNKKSITFTKGPITINYPGGKESKLAFTKAMSGWLYSKGIQSIKDGKAVRKVNRRISRASTVPSRIRSIRFGGRISAAEIDALAARAVWSA